MLLRETLTLFELTLEITTRNWWFFIHYNCEIFILNSNVNSQAIPKVLSEYISMRWHQENAFIECKFDIFTDVLSCVLLLQISRCAILVLSPSTKWHRICCAVLIRIEWKWFCLMWTIWIPSLRSALLVIHFLIFTSGDNAGYNHYWPIARPGNNRPPQMYSFHKRIYTSAW